MVSPLEKSIYSVAISEHLSKPDLIPLAQNLIPQFTEMVHENPSPNIFGQEWKVRAAIGEASDRLEIFLPLKQVAEHAGKPVRIAWYDPNREDHMIFGAFALASMLLQMPHKKHIVTISSSKSNKMIDLAAAIVSQIRGEEIGVTVFQKVDDGNETWDGNVYYAEEQQSHIIPYKPITAKKKIFLISTKDQEAFMQGITPDEIVIMDDVHSDGASYEAMIKQLQWIYLRPDLRPEGLFVFKEALFKDGKIVWDYGKSPGVHAAGMIPEFIGDLPVAA